MTTMAVEHRQQRWWLALLEGIASVILGLFLVTSPAISIAVMVTFLGAYWLVRGIFAIVEIFTGDSAVSWGWLLILGLLGIAAGLIVLRNPLYSAILVPSLVVLLLGIDALIMGVINFVRGFTGSGGWTAVLGVLDVLIGIILLARPVSAVLTLPILLGILAIIGGVALIVLSIRDRGAAAGETTKERRMAA